MSLLKLDDKLEFNFELGSEDLATILVSYFGEAEDSKANLLRPFYEEKRLDELLQLIQNLYTDYSHNGSKISVTEYRDRYVIAYGENTIKQVAIFLENGIYRNDNTKHNWGYYTAQNLYAAIGASEVQDIIMRRTQQMAMVKPEDTIEG